MGGLTWPKPLKPVASCATTLAGRRRKPSPTSIRRSQPGFLVTHQREWLDRNVQFLITDIAPESLEYSSGAGEGGDLSASVVRRAGMGKWLRSGKKALSFYFYLPLGVGVSVGGNDALVSCIVGL